MNRNENLKRDVEQELNWDSSVQADQVGVTVKGEVVQLDGSVNSLYEKWAAERAALRVNNVRAVANEIKVELPDTDERSDAAIAQSAISQLEWNNTVPSTVKVHVSNGWITFEGTVNSQYQKNEAENILRSSKGVKGIVNEIVVKPRVNVNVVKDSIIHAFERSAAIDAKKIQVETFDGVVTLRGEVRNWSEVEEARHTAWAAPGVTGVKEHLTIG
ncbi:MAG: BON domain-containing protein [Chthoniobacterales bacterium]